MSDIDHVTYVCEEGDSARILEFYRKTCGMKRFLVSPTEDQVRGVEIREEVGMRLMAGEWLSEWMCREEGVEWGQDEDKEGSNFKLVLAEPLPDSPHSHVTSFLTAHHGPGLQHIGLATSRMAHTVQVLKSGGAGFRQPPPTYYSLEGKREQIEAMGGEPEVFRGLGILIDPEQGDQGSYILQIFTQPLFAENTFFMEVKENVILHLLPFLDSKF